MKVQYVKFTKNADEAHTIFFNDGGIRHTKFDHVAKAMYAALKQDKEVKIFSTNVYANGLRYIKSYHITQ